MGCLIRIDTDLGGGAVVDLVIEILQKNITLTQKAIRELAKSYNSERTCNCQNALENAFITNPKVIPDETYKKLDLLVGKYHLKS